jgi:hypothetical protein
VNEAGGPNDVPTPALVAAWQRLGRVPHERVPLWAAHWLAEGRDSESLRVLAGEHGDDVVRVAELLPDVLDELGFPPPTNVVAAATLTFADIAQMCLSHRAREYWIAQVVADVIERSDWDDGVMNLPLGRIYGLDDEWKGKWGLSEPELADAVRRACEEQLATVHG